MRWLVALALLAGCSRTPAGGPPEIEYGKHECARCGMIVSDDLFAAGYVDDDGASVAFDDLGELLDLLEERPELRERAWARDLEGRGWLRLAGAHVTEVPGLSTPMGSGRVAFATREAAEAFVRARARR